ncbi:MAG: PAS domain-containing protein, partial [Anaerolineae bacterium]|nr:PAS domain-containing protein [Anaerolineae bacterium]
MQDQEKTTVPLSQESAILHRRIAELETALAECQQAHTVLQEAGTRGDQLFEYSGESIFIIDPDTLNILDANPIAARRLGYRRQELVHMSLDDIECP